MSVYSQGLQSSGHPSSSAPKPRSCGLRGVTLCCLLAALTGCGGDELDDLQAYVTEVKSRQKGQVEPLPELKTAEPFGFLPEGRRDPFARIDKKEENADRLRAGGGPQPDLARPKEDLEAFELDSLRMVGTVRLQHERALWGLVKAADGTIHRVHAGNHLGRNYGRIVQIKPDRIELVELVAASNAAWEERPAALDLNEAQAEDSAKKTR